MTTVAIIQARMGSTRLPGKVLRVLGDRSVLAHVIGRAVAIDGVDAVVVATSTQATDDPVRDEALKQGVQVYRGSEHDVLARYYGAAVSARADIVIRITSDCPLLDPFLVAAMLKCFSETLRGGEPLDYMSNALERTYPRGLDAEIFSFASLEAANQSASAPYEREHVTPYLYQHPELFRIKAYTGERDLSRNRWTLDTPADLALLAAIYERLYKPGSIFSTAEVLTLLEEIPDLLTLNAHVQQKSLEDKCA